MFKGRKKKKIGLELPLPARAFPDLATDLASAQRFDECSMTSPDVQMFLQRIVVTCADIDVGAAARDAISRVRE